MNLNSKQFHELAQKIERTAEKRKGVKYYVLVHEPFRIETIPIGFGTLVPVPNGHRFGFPNRDSRNKDDLTNYIWVKTFIKGERVHLDGFQNEIWHRRELFGFESPLYFYTLSNPMI
jgi:hypothetical protein